jgi:hypothetical protein
MNDRAQRNDATKAAPVTVVAAIVLGLAFVGTGLPFSLASGTGGPTSSWGV